MLVSTLCVYAFFIYGLCEYDMNMFVYDCLSLCLSVDVLHVDFEVVVAGELLVAQGAFSHGSVGIRVSLCLINIFFKLKDRSHT